MPEEDRPTTEQDDAEGHRFTERPEDEGEDDVEGHRNAPQRPEDEDEVEGHKQF